MRRLRRLTFIALAAALVTPLAVHAQKAETLGQAMAMASHLQKPILMEFFRDG